METGWSFIGIAVVVAAAVVAFAAATGWCPARRASIADRALAEIWSDPTGSMRSRRRTRRPAAHTHQHRPQRSNSRPGNYSRASSTR
jgi:hypothetical protein